VPKRTLDKRRAGPLDEGFFGNPKGVQCLCNFYDLEASELNLDPRKQGECCRQWDMRRRGGGVMASLKNCSKLFKRHCKEINYIIVTWGGGCVWLFFFIKNCSRVSNRDCN